MYYFNCDVSQLTDWRDANSADGTLIGFTVSYSILERVLAEWFIIGFPYFQGSYALVACHYVQLKTDDFGTEIKITPEPPSLWIFLKKIHGYYSGNQS